MHWLHQFSLFLCLCCYWLTTKPYFYYSILISNATISKNYPHIAPQSCARLPFIIYYSLVFITEPLPRGTSKLFNFYILQQFCAFALLVDVCLSLLVQLKSRFIQLNFLLDIISPSRLVDWIPVEKSFVRVRPLFGVLQLYHLSLIEPLW